MPVYLTFASLIIDKEAIEKKFKGGVNQFRNNYFKCQGKPSQEDDEVFLIARMNCNDYDLDELVSMGFEYDQTRKFSNDFVIHQRYYGYLWQVDWIEDNSFYVWHTKTESLLISKAKMFGEITMNEIEKLFENGQKPFIPLTIENVNTHPLSLLLDSYNSSDNEPFNT